MEDAMPFDLKIEDILINKPLYSFLFKCAFSSLNLILVYNFIKYKSEYSLLNLLKSTSILNPSDVNSESI